eukprot:10592518-Alexandrium_andersonii.AAC.1
MRLTTGRIAPQFGRGRSPVIARSVQRQGCLHSLAGVWPGWGPGRPPPSACGVARFEFQRSRAAT